MAGVLNPLRTIKWVSFIFPPDGKVRKAVLGRGDLDREEGCGRTSA